MNALADRDHWNKVWANEATPTPSVEARSHSYTDHVLYDVLFNQRLPRGGGRKIVEIGSAPGTVLVRLGRQFDWQPYGVEYTESGAEMNRRVFAANGIDPAHVIHADFFSDEFQRSHRDFFDVVVSRGFIEHFTDVARAVRSHVAITKPGGHVVIVIPRFRGVYWAWMRLFDPEDLARHNLDIMEMDGFAAAFEHQGLTPLYCGHLGTFSLKRFELPGQGPIVSLQRRLIHAGSRAIDRLSRRLLKPPGLDSRLVSPYLAYVGRKA
jgi:SAM-dependent methyltransferase